MNRLIFFILIVICLNPYSACAANISKIEQELIIADSLLSQKHYKEIIQLLVPLEPIINVSEDRILKSNYYYLLSTSYLCNNAYTKCVEYLDKHSAYNTFNLEDLICAANISIMELKDYDKSQRYARRALIKYFGNSFYENNVSVTAIGRLLYLLGMSYTNSKSSDLFMATECLKIHSALNLTDQSKLNQDLTEHIKTINNSNLIPLDLHPKELIKVNFFSDTTQPHKLNLKEYSRKSAAESHIITLSSLEHYLCDVLSLDSIYKANNDIYSSKRLLDQAIHNINVSNIVLSSHKGIQLMVRLGQIYSLLKDYDEALEWFFFAKDRCDGIEDSNLSLLTILHEMADIYMKKDLFWSRLFIEEAIEIFENIFGNIYTSNRSEAYSLLISYALILTECNNIEVAENTYRHILKKCHSKNEIIFTLNNYGVFLSSHGRNTEALHYFDQLNNIFPCVSTMSNPIIAYINNGNMKAAEIALKKYIDASIAESIYAFETFSNDEIENWWNQYVQELYMSCNYLANKINSSQSLQMGFDATLFCKTITNLYESVIRSYRHSCNGMFLKRLQSELRHQKDKLKNNKNSNFDEYDLLHLKIQQIEDSLKRTIPDITQRIMHERITYKDISMSLSEGDAAIEFFEYVDLQSDSTQIFYAAYVVLPNIEAPILVKLAPFESTTSHIRDILFDETELNNTYSSSNYTIFNTLWKKLMPYICNKTNIYYSTSGALSFINHDIIHDENGLKLSDRFNLYRVSSTSQIKLAKKVFNNDYTSAVLYGNINFDTTPSLMRQLVDKTPDKIFASSKHVCIKSESMRNGCIPLPHSGNEIYGINDLMNSIGVKTKLFEYSQANEESFWQLDGQSPDIIHIATHGFSAYKHKNSQTRLNHQTIYDYTLSLEGLLFSGANNILKGKEIPENIEDGILTAEEIATMDLSNTQLVVLSACETGKGSINVLGRVLGLQEAFKMAGVETILMSLWQVPDESTAILMVNFYNALFNGLNCHEALKTAMEKTKALFPDPYYWGAFVILD